MRFILTWPLILVCLTACVSAGPKSADDNVKILKIYHTNDIHAHLNPNSQGRGGFAYLASVLKVVHKQESEALILDAGDFYAKGSLPSQISKDEVTADLISQMPYYTARAVGNNEIKVGIPKFLIWANKKETAPLLSANFVDKNKKLVFPPYQIFKKNGLNIGIIGLTPKFKIEDNVQPDFQKDPRAPYDVLEPNEAVLPYVKELRPQVDVLILLAHNHYRENVKLASEHPEIDLIVSGHTHFFTGDKKALGHNLVVESGQFGQQIGVVTLTYSVTDKKTAAIDATSWPVGVGLQLPDENIAKAIKKIYATWAPHSFEALGETTGNMKVIDLQNPVEGQLDDWVADQFVDVSKADMALVNREALRETMYKGPINRESVFLSAPYDDKVAIISISPRQVEAMLKNNIVKVMPVTTLFPFAFSGATSQLWLHNGEFKKAQFQVKSTKPTITLALPNYLVTHCKDFFQPKECPLKVVGEGPEIRTVIEQAIKKSKTIYPPPADRVTVHDDGGDTLPQVDAVGEEDPDYDS